MDGKIERKIVKKKKKHKVHTYEFKNKFIQIEIIFEKANSIK